MHQQCDCLQSCPPVCENGSSAFAGSTLLTTEEEAVTQAEATGFPVLLKATGGGGGIGIYQCADSADVRTHFTAAQRYLSESCHGLAGKACHAPHQGLRNAEVHHCHIYRYSLWLSNKHTNGTGTSARYMKDGCTMSSDHSNLQAGESQLWGFRRVCREVCGECTAH